MTGTSSDLLPGYDSRWLPAGPSHVCARPRKLDFTTAEQAAYPATRATSATTACLSDVSKNTPRLKFTGQRRHAASCRLSPDGWLVRDGTSDPSWVLRPTTGTQKSAVQVREGLQKVPNICRRVDGRREGRHMQNRSLDTHRSVQPPPRVYEHPGGCTDTPKSVQLLGRARSPRHVPSTLRTSATSIVRPETDDITGSVRLEQRANA